ncbi:PREDICTED: HVA22-like protein k [Populus euphratica]|uniref:HVA22-like protein n=1 Tax=Populus euphratica TaxID=75702 RepID=A0AAJ6VJJ2_POPEU|nr:PREDICTED: HVA22-like protein k [Populus euphratica]
MAFPGKVGLQLLLSPLSSNIVVRTACCSVGIALPIYSTFKAIENKDQIEQQRWLLYWAAYGSFSLAEVFADKILSWFPLYHHMKFAFLVWLQLPSANGAGQLYMSHLRPFLLRHQARLDNFVEFLYGEMNKFVSAHQAEFQFAKALLMKILASVNQIARDVIRPGGRQANGTFQGPARRIQDSQSDGED